MLKRAAHIVVSILLILSTAGFTVTRHYCGTTVVKVTLNSHPESCCGHKPCCHNETSFFQLKENFFAPDNTTHVKAPLADIIAFPVIYINLLDQVQTGFTPIYPNESPPPVNTHTVLSLLQSFLC
jgi:hypothetical protein